MVWPSTAARVAVPLSTVSIMYDSMIPAVEALMHCRAVRVLRRLCTPPAAPRTERTSCGSTIVPPLPTAPAIIARCMGTAMRLPWPTPVQASSPSSSIALGKIDS